MYPTDIRYRVLIELIEATGVISVPGCLIHVAEARIPLGAFRYLCPGLLIKSCRFLLVPII